MRKLIFICCNVLLFCVHSLALKPSHTYIAIPDTMKLPYEKATITTADGVHLKSWTFLPADSINNKINLVIANADAGNMSMFIYHAMLLSQVGYTVTLFDYRGFGESDSFAMDNRYLYYNEFAKDLSATVTYERNKHPKYKTGIWCFSMGTIITTIAAQRLKPDFIIGEGFVTSPERIKETAAARGKELLLPSGADNYNKALHQIKTPMLLFAGNQDMNTPAADVIKLKETMPNITLVTFEGGHMEGLQKLSKDFYGSEYIGDINTFIVEKFHKQ